MLRGEQARPGEAQAFAAKIRQNAVYLLGSLFWGVCYLYIFTTYLAPYFTAPWGAYYPAATMQRVVFTCSLVLYIGFTLLDPQPRETFSNLIMNGGVSFRLMFSPYLAHKHPLVFAIVAAATLLAAALPACLIRAAVPKAKWHQGLSAMVFKTVRAGLLAGVLLMALVFFLSSVFSHPTLSAQESGAKTAPAVAG